MTNKTKLVLVSGANRGIGEAFINKYKNQSQTITIGISRTGSLDYNLDLMNVNKAYRFVNELSLKNISSIIYLHSIGIMKFEPEGKPEIDFDGDGIDDQVLSTNYLTFLHLVEPLIDKVSKEGIPMTIGTIGSISDAFEIPYWQSLYKSKNKLRKFCKSINQKDIKTLMLNVGSTLDKEGNTYGRKNIDTTYWQTVDEFVENSFDNLDDFKNSKSSFGELDFYKHNPLFRTDYFTNLPNLYSIWQRDLGYEGKEIPLGIRI